MMNTYIGDGVHVESTDDGIALFTIDANEKGNLTIYLGKESIVKLIKFIGLMVDATFEPDRTIISQEEVDSMKMGNNDYDYEWNK